LNVARLFHTTSLLQKSHPREIKRRNIAKKISKLQQENSKRPNIITGIPTPFTNSLLRPSQIYASANSTPHSISQNRNFFLDEKDEEFLFKIAPDIIIEKSITEPEKELEKVQILKNLTSLHNASSKGILLYNIQLAIKEFARKEGDTGSAEVQGN
jgi:hypothetical protein